MQVGSVKIIRQTALAALVIIFMVGLALVFVVITIRHINQSYQADSRFNAVMQQAHRARRAEKDFLLEEYNDETFVKSGQGMFYGQNVQALHHADSLLTELKANDVCTDLGLAPALDELRRSLDEYRTVFGSITDLYRQRGFKNNGLEGRMRRAIHAIDSIPFPVERSHLLSLRRDEKDFFLRKEEEYLSKFDINLTRYKAKINEAIATGADSSAGNRVKVLLTEYQTLFEQIVEIEKRIGLNDGEGLRNQLNLSFASIEQQLVVVSDWLVSHAEARTRRAVVAIVVLFLLMTAVLVACLYYFARIIFRPIGELETIAQTIAQGNLAVSLDAKRYHPLLRGLVNSFATMIGRMQSVIGNLTRIAQGDLAMAHQQTDEQDEITRAVTTLALQLQTLKAEEARQNWLNANQAALAQLLQRQNNVEELCHAALKHLVTCVKANQGAVFTDTGQDDNLHLTACIAFDKKKHLEKSIGKDEGLVGQCWLEGQLIHLTEVPPDYIRITSGLGEALPRTVLLVPLAADGNRQGVLELATFGNLAEHETAFLEKAGQQMAAALARLRMVTQLQNAVLN
ncbi:MAG: GAF domain-containing protein [Cytophagales bacterium]|nr:GAF domain-containing protein [Cytophagales bacterium]